MGDHPAARPVTPPNSTPCRVLLRTIRGALSIPYPAGVADEHAYYVLRSKRCGLAIEAIDRILADPEAGDEDALAAAGILSRQLGKLPPDTYRQSGLSS